MVAGHMYENTSDLSYQRRQCWLWVTQLGPLVYATPFYFINFARLEELVEAKTLVFKLLRFGLILLAFIYFWSQRTVEIAFFSGRCMPSWFHSRIQTK